MNFVQTMFLLSVRKEEGGVPGTVAYLRIEVMKDPENEPAV